MHRRLSIPFISKNKKNELNKINMKISTNISFKHSIK